MYSKLNAYLINISVILQNYLDKDYNSSGVEYNYYAIVIADDINSAYQACERDKSSAFYKYITKDYFYNTVKLLDNKTDYTETLNMKWYMKRSDVLYSKYDLKKHQTNEFILSGNSLIDAKYISNYNNLQCYL